ncbi:putative pyridoxamine 5'-phosphate oxidase [Actinacidiphila reveromycinica]|uniref:Putative pyridoxamine 5'-phosphate oxidase n=1 Tax=Actinacidiphila reveromycinica TaxID=659352 RepID=A0A7U3VSE6_9ACTN|nr:pyridoxal 5'-phosphate synthase [Streptomyces sp. SN-593]BBB01755.1 putative pyridoxamine 5'-phosphate oxidase [Streptomyces sp. SN-593]
MSDLREVLREIEVFEGELPDFDVSELPADPHELFTEWLLNAIRRGVREPHAMTVSTTGLDGSPSARVLICKDITADGWQFAADRDSRKGRELSARPAASLTFYWSPLARQVRVRGTVRPGTPDESAADFLARSPGARAEALLGRQSAPLADLAVRDADVREAAGRIAARPGLVAPGWTLYTLRAEQVEFWQGDKERRHTRVEYRRTDAGWERGLLWP